MSKKVPVSTPAPSKRKQPSGYAKRQKAIQKAAHQLIAQSDNADGVAIFSAGRPTDAVQELPVLGVPPPKFVGAIERVLIDLEAGNFTNAAQLADGMLRDPIVFGALDVRVRGLLGSRLDFEPAMDTNRARRVKEDCEQLFASMCPTPEISELLRWGITLGVGIAQVIYERDGRSWTPTIKVFHPKFLRWSTLDNRYHLQTADQGEIVIEPDDPQWIVFEPYGARGWLRCLMRAIAMPWLIRSWTRDWWARYCELHGRPMRLGIIPEGADPADVKLFLAQLSNLGGEAVMRLRQGAEGNKFDAKLLEAQSNSWQGFQELLKQCDSEIAIAVLGQRSSSQGSSGLGSDANPGDSVRIDIKRSDATIGDVIRDQVLCPWAAFNYGSADLAPWPKWQVDPPEDLQKKALEVLTLMQALQIAPPELDKRTVIESFNLPLLEIAQMPPDVPGTPDTGPADPDDAADDADDDTEQQTRNASSTAKLSARIERLSEAAKTGDVYGMALAAKAKQLAAASLGPDLATVKAAVEASASPSELRTKLKAAFADMDPEALADVTHKALILANLAGRAAVHRDVKR